MKINTIKEFKNAAGKRIENIYISSNNKYKKVRKVIKNVYEIRNAYKKHKAYGTRFFRELRRFSN